MSIGIKIKKGLDLHLEGAVSDPLDVIECPAATVAVIPDDFEGFVPKMDVREGDHVLAGQPLMHHKLAEQIKLVSPAEGTVKAVVRGERRKILRVEVEVDSAAQGAVVFDVAHAAESADKAKELLMQSGLWAMMRQRPYDIVPEVGAEIRDVFVTGFDSAPLAHTPAEFTEEQRRCFAAGVKLLQALTKGKVYVSRRKGEDLPDIPGAEMADICGPHPSGNAGTMIAAIRPVNKGETVVCLSLDTLDRIGALMLTGKVPMATVVAVTGSEVEHPRLVRTLIGADMADLLKGDVKNDSRHHRIISGNVLTGHLSSLDDYLHFPYTQITVIPEGDDVAEFMGWASLSPRKMSVSPSFPGHFLGKKLFNPDARLLGGRRAMIMSGEYDKMIPMDILPEYLIKAILAHDIDRMEQLGIYEVAPEDFALAEYADTSKLELQKIVREGLDYLRKELE